MSSLTSVFAFMLSIGLIPLSLQISGPEAEPEITVPAPSPIRTIEGAERDALLAEISASFGQISTAKGRFFQRGADFSESEGDFYLRRPGRVRFDYDDPNPLLIIADGATVAIEDADLETQDRVPLATTPLAILLDDELDFETEANVLDVRQANGVIGLTLEDRSGENEGVLTVVLDESNYSIVGWEAQDPAGGVTSVQLAAVETDVRLSPRLFRIEDINADDERD